MRITHATPPVLRQLFLPLRNLSSTAYIWRVSANGYSYLALIDELFAGVSARRTVLRTRMSFTELPPAISPSFNPQPPYHC